MPLLEMRSQTEGHELTQEEKIKLAVDAAWTELEKNDKDYVNRVDQQIDGYIDMEAVVKAILETLQANP